MARVESFEGIAEEFARRVQRTVWCTMATADTARRIRSRIVHPIWDGKTGWLLTGRHSAKAEDVDRSPWASLTYIDSAQEQVHADCRTSWEEQLPEKRRLWNWFSAHPAQLLLALRGRVWVESGSWSAGNPCQSRREGTLSLV